jgi:hypothetical protein
VDSPAEQGKAALQQGRASGKEAAGKIRPEKNALQRLCMPGPQTKSSSIIIAIISHVCSQTRCGRLLAVATGTSLFSGLLFFAQSMFRPILSLNCCCRCHRVQGLRFPSHWRLSMLWHSNSFCILYLSRLLEVRFVCECRTVNDSVSHSLTRF